MEFSGERILVTGATKGIGRATAKLPAERGRHRRRVRPRQGELDSLARRSAARPSAATCPTPTATRAAARAVQPIDRLVNNAGTVTLQPFLETTGEAFEQQMAVNVLAAMIVSQEARAT